jgi:guanylate kinase
MPESHTVFIVSAPSGAGKSSLLKALLQTDHCLSLSISHTTRAMRPGEKNGEDYHFVDPATFQQMIKQNAFLEYAQVFDHTYGTAQATLQAQLTEQDVLVEIDWQGARQIRERFPSAVSIFIAPPSIDALRQRLSSRGQDSEAIIERRMRDAQNELAHYAEYNYLIINDVFDQALQDIQHIVAAQRLGIARQQQAQAHLLDAMLPGR